MKDEVAEMDKEINENQAHKVDDRGRFGSPPSAFLSAQKSAQKSIFAGKS